VLWIRSLVFWTATYRRNHATSCLWAVLLCTAALAGGCGAPSIRSNFIAVPSDALIEIASKRDAAGSPSRMPEHLGLVATGFVPISAEHAIVIVTASVPDWLAREPDQVTEFVKAFQWQVGFEGRVTLVDQRGRVHRAQKFAVEDGRLGTASLPEVSAARDAVQLASTTPSEVRGFDLLSWAVVCRFGGEVRLNELRDPIRVQISQRGVDLATRLGRIGPLRGEEAVLLPLKVDRDESDAAPHIVRVLMGSARKVPGPP
jgi:hypothetical protein